MKYDDIMDRLDKMKEKWNMKVSNENNMIPQYSKKYNKIGKKHKIKKWISEIKNENENGNENNRYKFIFESINKPYLLNKLKYNKYINDMVKNYQHILSATEIIKKMRKETNFDISNEEMISKYEKYNNNNNMDKGEKWKIYGKIIEDKIGKIIKKYYNNEETDKKMKLNYEFKKNISIIENWRCEKNDSNGINEISMIKNKSMREINKKNGFNEKNEFNEFNGFNERYKTKERYETNKFNETQEFNEDKNTNNRKYSLLWKSIIYENGFNDIYSDKHVKLFERDKKCIIKKRYSTNINGQVDGIVKNQYIIEIKAPVSGNIKYVPNYHDYMQLQIYLITMNIEEGILLYWAPTCSIGYKIIKLSDEVIDYKLLLNMKECDNKESNLNETKIKQMIEQDKRYRDKYEESFENVKKYVSYEIIYYYQLRNIHETPLELGKTFKSENGIKILESKNKYMRSNDTKETSILYGLKGYKYKAMDKTSIKEHKSNIGINAEMDRYYKEIEHGEIENIEIENEKHNETNSERELYMILRSNKMERIGIEWIIGIVNIKEYTKYFKSIKMIKEIKNIVFKS